VRLGTTRVEELERVVADVRAAGATVAGVVVQYPRRRRWAGRRDRNPVPSQRTGPPALPAMPALVVPSVSKAK
jgi:hypothetical protein